MKQASLWESKPWWCQPWTIILTGVMAITGSWWLWRSLWLTLPVTGLIIIWWAYFLIVVPQAIAKMAQNEKSEQ
jgi:hypothetical protein